MKLIGLSGSNGAGKDLVGKILANKHDYLFVSVSDLLRQECRNRGLAVERENLRTVSSEWRKTGGLAILVDKAVETFQAQVSRQKYHGLALASIRNPGEADRIHELGGSMIWVDADPKIRYNRIFSRRRSSEDIKSFEQFQAEELAEMQGDPSDPTSLNMNAVKQKCDLTILNEGNAIEMLTNDVAAALQPFGLV